MNFNKKILMTVLVSCGVALTAFAVENSLVSGSDEARLNEELQNQKRRITGVVTDSDNAPVVGAIVLERGTANAVTSDVNGNYAIEVAPGAVIEASLLGYERTAITVGQQTTINITLVEDISRIEEVVVVGYGSLARKEVTSAISQVSSKDFLQIGGNNALMQIQGKIAGVNISNTASADPNSGASIQIRGVASRAGRLGPLIVIDGIPGGELGNVHYSDVESITILKDGAASAIYGTRGSNGVVLVTTKKGTTDGVARVSYSGYAYLQIPKQDLEQLSAEEYVARGFTDQGGRTDWWKEVSRQSVSHSHSIQLSGGNARTSYRISLDYENNQGVDLRANRDEYGARIFVSHQALNGLMDFQVSVAPRIVHQNNSDNNAFNLARTVDPTWPVMDPTDPTGQKYQFVTGVESSNPVENLMLQINGRDRRMLDWNATAKLNLLPLISETSTRHSLNTSVTVAQQYNDTFRFEWTPSTYTGQIRDGRKGDARRQYNVDKRNSIEWLVNYMYDDGDHSIRFMGGYSHQYSNSQSLSARNRDFASDLVTYNNLGSGAYDKVSGRSDMGSSQSDSRLIGFFGRVNYSWRDKYMFTASIRREGSSQFGINNKWGNFPAVSAGWRISEESFMENASWIDELKLRADYGITGNEPNRNYLTLPTMGSYGSVIYNGTSYVGWSMNKNVNPDLKWELGKNFNLGLDFTLFNNRLSGTFNYYSRRQVDLLGEYNVAVPPNVQTSTWANVGTMANSGIEIELNIEAVRTRDFSYNMSLTGATNNNKFVSFSNELYQGQDFYWLDNFAAPGTPGPVQRIEEGERIGNFVTFEYAGVDEDGEWLVYDKNGEKVSIYGRPDDDKRVVGNGLPKFTASWGNTFNYKKWDLSLYFRGNFGFQTYNSSEFYNGLQDLTGQNYLKIAFTKNAHIKGANVHNSYFVLNGDFVKLDVATLGYTANVDSRFFKGDMRFYFTARNLLTFKNKRLLDPDLYNLNGMQPGILQGKKGYYPASRQFMLGVMFNF